MPKSDKPSTIARQWEMLKMIPTRRPGITVRKLRDQLTEEGFPVSIRTIERDLDGLSSLFDLVDEQDPTSRAKSWYYASGKAPELGSIELADAVSLALAGDVLEKLLPGVLMEPVTQKIAKARSKLKTMNQVGLARWSEKVRYVPGTLELQAPQIQPKIMTSVQNALLEGKQVEITYDPFNEKSKKLRLNPLSLVLRGSVPYVVATAFAYPDLRLYAIHRMRKVEILDEPVSVPDDYSVDAYLESGAMNFNPGKTFKIKARLTKDLAIYLSETPLSLDQKINFRNDGYELTATVQDSWQLHFWLMSQGPGITILSPENLRARTQGALKAALANYSQ